MVFRRTEKSAAEGFEKRHAGKKARQRRRSSGNALILEPLESRTLLNGVTIITHGAELFSGIGSTSRPSWIDEMGSAIATRLGGGVPIYALRIEPGSGPNGLAVTQFVKLSGPATTATSSIGQSILLLDWAAASNVSLLTLMADYSTTAVAQMVVPYLTQAFPSIGITTPFAEGAIDMIGHSRGGSVITELANDLGQMGLWVDDVTTLDPRPTLGDNLNPTLGANVVFGDNYYQDSGDGILTPNGMVIPGAYNVGPLNVPGGLGSTHNNIPMFYEGTINTAANASFQSTPIPDSWYSGNGVTRALTGFYYSALGGGATVRPAAGIGSDFGGAGSRTGLSHSGAQWANLAMVTPSTGQIAAGQTFAVSFKYGSYNTSATITWFLDPDNNPYNGNSIAVSGPVNIGATGDNAAGGVSYLNAASLPQGTYYLEGVITNSTGTRYAYSAASVADTNQAPIGSIDTPGPAALQGWAIDPDAKSTSVSVRLDVDGSTFATTTANLTRNDLVSRFGSANHGYSFDLTSLSTGTHRVDLYATDTTSGQAVLIASRTITTNHTPLGNVDWFDGSELAGWAMDPDVAGSQIQVHYSVDGGAPSFLATNQTRADVNSHFNISGQHGYAVVLPQLRAGTHTVSVWAVDPVSKALTLIGTRQATVTAPAGNALPIGNVDLLNATTVAGWAYDPSTLGTAINIRIDVDGVAGSPVLANLARGDLAVLPGGPNYAFRQSLSLAPGEHRIDVYALDSTSNTPMLLTSRVVDVPAVTPVTAPATPIGSIDMVNANQIAGWAYYRALALNGGGTASPLIRIDIDGLPGTATTTNLTRGDVNAAYGPGTFGFSLAMPKLASGNHTVTLWVIDPLTLLATSVASRNLVT